MDDFEFQQWVNFHQISWFFHDGKETLTCESCDKEFTKGELVIDSDAGYFCEDCSTE